MSDTFDHSGDAWHAFEDRRYDDPFGMSTRSQDAKSMDAMISRGTPKRLASRPIPDECLTCETRKRTDNHTFCIDCRRKALKESK